MKSDLYLATKTIKVMFLCPSNYSTQSVLKEANHFADEEGKNIVDGRIKIEKITKIEDIPEEWRGDAYIWGTDEEMTATDFLGQEDDEYQEYLRLKKKYEE